MTVSRPYNFPSVDALDFHAFDLRFHRSITAARIVLILRFTILGLALPVYGEARGFLMPCLQQSSCTPSTGSIG